MAPQKKKNDKEEKNKFTKEEHDKELKRKDLVKKIQSLAEEIEKEHLLRDELSDRKSSLECFWKDERETIKEHQMQYHCLRDEIRSTRVKHKIQIDDMKGTIKNQLHHQQESILKTKNKAIFELRSFHYKNVEDIQARDFDTAAYLDALRDVEITHNAFLHELERDFSGKESELNEEFKRRHHDVTIRCEQNLNSIREESQYRARSEMEQLAAENKMKSNHKIKAFEEISERQRIYFKETLQTQLDEIESLKAAVNQKRQILMQSKKKRKHAETKNGAIKHPYETLKHDVESLANKADKFDSVKKILSKKKAELKLKEDTLKNLKWKHEIMFQQFELLNVEKKQKQKDLIQTSLSLQQRERFASTLLKKENDT